MGFSGWIGISFVFRWFDKREELRIGPAGIRLRRWPDRMITWPEILRVSDTSWYRSGPRITLQLRNDGPFRSSDYIRGAASAVRNLTGGVSIYLSTIDCSIADVLSAVERFRH